MNWFKRLCMFLFGLMGLFALCALALTCVQNPLTAQARSLLGNPIYFYAVVICTAVCAVGLVITLLIALFYPRNPKETVVAEVAGGKITVTRQAIVSQVRHIIEGDGKCKASSIRVTVRKRGNVRVNVRVKPLAPLNVVEYGEALYAKLAAGLAEVCGDSVKSVDVIFMEPQRIATVEESAGVGEANESTSGNASQTISVNPSEMGWSTGAGDNEPATTDDQYVPADTATSYSWTPEQETQDFSQDDTEALAQAPTIVLDQAADETPEEV